MFLSILKKKIGQSNTGFVYAHQDRGKPIKLLKVTQAQIGSSNASASTLKKRSQMMEKITENLSSPTMAEEDVIHQTANSINRNQQQFLTSCKEGGINIIQSFTLKQVSIYRKKKIAISFFATSSNIYTVKIMPSQISHKAWACLFALFANCIN